MRNHCNDYPHAGHHVADTLVNPCEYAEKNQAYNIKD